MEVSGIRDLGNQLELSSVSNGSQLLNGRKGRKGLLNGDGMVQGYREVGE